MLTRETVYRPHAVTFFFDPICPWTWITSRWLVEVAEARHMGVHWRAFSLARLNGGVENMPERFQEAGRFSVRALRMIEALRADGKNEEIGAFFTELGTRLHVDGEAPSRQLLAECADAASVTSYVDAADDPAWDDAVNTSTDTAVRLAGPDVGSPVLQIGDHATHGPIVSPAPTGEDAVQLWDALSALIQVPGFYEMKHGRSGAPQVQPAGRERQTAAR